MPTPHPETVDIKISLAEQRLDQTEETLSDLEKDVKESTIEMNRGLAQLTANIANLASRMDAWAGKMDKSMLALTDLTKEMARTNEQVANAIRNNDKMEAEIKELRTAQSSHAVELARLTGIENANTQVQKERNSVTESFWADKRAWMVAAFSLLGGVLLSFLKDTLLRK